jgi:branched-chain amino acid transport system substrate-binding protein
VDDAGNPAQGLSEVKNLVEQHHVVAIIGSNTGTTSSWLPYLAQNHIPLIGGAAAGAGTSAYSFPSSLSVSSLVTASFQLDKQVGLTKVGELLALGGAFNLSEFEGQLRQAATAAGVGIVYSAGVSPTAPDYTAQCLSLKNAGATISSVGISPSVTLNIIKTCLQQGYSGAFFTTSGLANPAWNKEAALKGSRIYVLDDVWPFYQQSTPAQKEYFQAIQQYAPTMLTNPGYNAYVQDAWTGMEMFKAAAKAANIGPNSTSTDVVNGLYKLHNETLGGLIGPVTFSKTDKVHLANCYFVSLLANGEWSDPLGEKAQCVTP